jgi:hypothetical protein
MKIVRSYSLITVALLWTCFSMCALAIAVPLDSSEATGAATSTGLLNNDGAPSSSQQEPTTGFKARDPIETLLANRERAIAENGGVSGSRSVNGAAPAAYPAGSSSSWSPTHFEIFGDVQWRNLSNSSGFSSSYCLPSGCVTNTGSFSTNLGLNKWGFGPDFGFIWTPDKEILGAKSRVWVEWEQLDRSNTRTVFGSFTFDGVTYTVNTIVKTQLNTNLFSLGYSPQWGNNKFRIGPEVVFQHLSVDVILTNLTPGAPPPIKQEVNVPNFMAIIGLNFDYKPVQQLDVYGRSGWIPCCGGGWHGNQTEFGAKYYVRRNFGILVGFRYYWLKRDFNLAAQEVTTSAGTVTLGPFSGFIKFPGVGPFVGASYRF